MDKFIDWLRGERNIEIEFTIPFRQVFVQVCLYISFTKVLAIIALLLWYAVLRRAFSG